MQLNLYSNFRNFTFSGINIKIRPPKIWPSLEKSLIFTMVPPKYRTLRWLHHDSIEDSGDATGNGWGLTHHLWSELSYRLAKFSFNFFGPSRFLDWRRHWWKRVCLLLENELTGRVEFPTEASFGGVGGRPPRKKKKRKKKKKKEKKKRKKERRELWITSNYYI